MNTEDLEKRTIEALRKNKFLEYLPLEDAIKNPNAKLISDLFENYFP